MSSPFQRAKVIEQPAGPLLSIETLRNQCEVVPIDGDSDAETHPDDALLLGLLDAAVKAAEDFTGRSIQLRTWEKAFDSFPDGPIELPCPPLVELVSVTAQNDSDGELDESDYTLDNFGDVARLVPVTAWPTLEAATNNVRVRFRAGYQSESDPDSDAQPLDAKIRQAILLAVGYWYENREAVDPPAGFHLLLRSSRVRMGFA